MQKTFELKDMLNGSQVNDFYGQTSSLFKTAGYKAGHDAGNGDFDVKLCLQSYDRVRVTWDEGKFGDLEKELPKILSEIIQVGPRTRVFYAVVEEHEKDTTPAHHFGGI